MAMARKDMKCGLCFLMFASAANMAVGNFHHGINMSFAGFDGQNFVVTDNVFDVINHIAHRQLAAMRGQAPTFMTDDLARNLRELSSKTRCTFANGKCSMNPSAGAALQKPMTKKAKARYGECSGLDATACGSKKTCNWLAATNVCEAYITSGEEEQIIGEALGDAASCAGYGSLYAKQAECQALTANTCTAQYCKKVDGNKQNGATCPSSSWCDYDQTKVNEIVCAGKSMDAMFDKCKSHKDVNEYNACITRECPFQGRQVQAIFELSASCKVSCTNDGCLDMKTGPQAGKCLLDSDYLMIKLLPTECPLRKIMQRLRTCVGTAAAITGESACGGMSACKWTKTEQCDGTTVKSTHYCEDKPDDADFTNFVTGGCSSDLQELSATMQSTQKCPGFSEESACTGFTPTAPSCTGDETTASGVGTLLPKMVLLITVMLMSFASI